MRSQVGTTGILVLACDFEIEEQSGFVRIVIIAWAMSGDDEAELAVQRERGGVGFANFEEKLRCSALLAHSQHTLQEKTGDSLPTIWGSDRNVKDFSLLRDLPPLKNGDHLSTELAHVHFVGSELLWLWIPRISGSDRRKSRFAEDSLNGRGVRWKAFAHQRWRRVLWTVIRCV